MIRADRRAKHDQQLDELLHSPRGPVRRAGGRWPRGEQQQQRQQQQRRPPSAEITMQSVALAVSMPDVSARLGHRQVSRAIFMLEEERAFDHNPR